MALRFRRFFLTLGVFAFAVMVGSTPMALGGAFVMLVLVAQKHEDELNAHRDTLTLELAILSEHKIAKVIQLLEELRRDSPHVQDRDDPQAEEMAEPADAGSVLAAVRANDRQK